MLFLLPKDDLHLIWCNIWIKLYKFVNVHDGIAFNSFTDVKNLALKIDLPGIFEQSIYISQHVILD